MKRKYERGQSLVMVALILAGLIAVAALIVDGGNIYLNRRQAQTAADAAAMAGAHELCAKGGNLTSVTTLVTRYAVVENRATSLDSVSIVGGQVQVAVTKSTQSFFAPIFGQNANVATAEAAAGCFTPAAYKGVLPIAWTCRPPEGQTPQPDCYLHKVPFNIFTTLYSNIADYKGKAGKIFDEGDGVIPTSYLDGVGGKMIYIVMDVDKFNHAKDCAPPIGAGSIICDLNGDGVSDVYGGANRGWLYLDGKPGAAAIGNIVEKGFQTPVKIPQWFEGTNGGQASVFDAVEKRVGQIVVLLPIYTAICDGKGGKGTTKEKLPTDCPSVFIAGDEISQATSGNSSTFYRVAGFAPFVVTCVSKGNSDKCPGKEYAKLPNNQKTLEGYFLDGYATGSDIAPGGGLDLGVYIISLTK